MVNLFKYGYSFEFTKPKELSSNLLKKDISLDQGIKKIFYSFLNDLLGASKEKDLSKDKKERKNKLKHLSIVYF